MNYIKIGVSASQPEAALTGIEVTAPTKTEYEIGEKLDTSGLVVTARYSDGSAAVLTETQYTLTGFSSEEAGEKTVTVSYTEDGVTKTAAFVVTVKELPSVVLEGIEITAPAKTEYKVGDPLDTSGISVTAKYSDGSSRLLEEDQYIISGFSSEKAGEKMVTVSYTEGGVTKTTTTPVTVTSISNTLASNSWATIRAVSDAGKGSNYWSVGDAKGITINGKVGATTFSNLAISVFILGFNHNASREGSNRIHFQIGKINGTLVGLVDGNYGNSISTTGAFTMNTSYTNSGGWNNSHMRKTVLGSNSASATSPTANTLLAALPADLRAVMKPATKYSDNTGGGSDTASYVTSTTDLLPLLSEFEYHGARTYANSAEKNYQAQYDYYKAGNSKVHYKHNATGTAAYVWCRSVYSSHGYIFCLVYTDGGAGNHYASRSWALAPCFFV